MNELSLFSYVHGSSSPNPNFSISPLNHLSDTKDGHSLLLFRYWEECLKERYEHFVFALEETSRDVIAKLKSVALKTIYMLLKSKSEQERRLLSSLVNKLGDLENKVASNAYYHLANLLPEHPNMKVLISEAGAAPSKAKYNAEASNSSKEDKAKVPSEPHVEMGSRLLSALLTGVNRAFPFVSSDEADDVIEVQTPLLFQLVHSKNFNIGVQALMLLDKISSKNQIVSDRFYRALYAKLLLPSATNSSKEEMFFALVLRAMKNDINIKRVAAFSKRLLQVALQLPPQYACGCLFLLSEVLKARPPLWNMVLQNETADDDLEHFEDIKETDENPDILAQNKDNKDLVADTKDESDNDSDSALNEGGSANSDSEEDSLNEDENLLGNGDMYKLEEVKSTADNEVNDLQGLTLPGGYNPRHREPAYCNADRVGWWELMVLASHVHPSVAAMASTLLSGVNIVYNGNPINDLSLGAFLDKFMEKKPRQSTWHGASQIEPAKKLDMNHQLIGAEILSLAEADVPPEDVVFHKFYMNKMNSSKKPKKKKKKTAEDEAAEELYTVDNGDDDDEDGSENEGIDNILDSVDDPSVESPEGDYNYDDLDNIDNEDDEDLIGDASDDEEVDFPSEIEADDEIEVTSGEENSDDDDDIAIGEADDGSDFEESFDHQRKNKRKSRKEKSGASPFASLEDYEHLIEDEDPESKEKERKKKPKSKKRKISG